MTRYLPIRRTILIGALLLASACSAFAAEPSAHPRLYFAAADLPRLRALRAEGVHARIAKNLFESADWCLTQTPRKTWIAPIEPDPIYENLYDRFYAIMGDLAVTEHLAFAYALSGEARYGDAARDWILASARAWRREADGEPNGAKAYAVCRLLKGLAVGYDLVFDRLSDAERQEVRETIFAIGKKYYDGYFTTPTIAGPTFHTHHAVVEWGSFGVAALALLDELPEAKSWVEATEKKFADHLLPNGLAPDGAQVEGGTFWASTMHYRLFFLDALRRVTGHDLLTGQSAAMNADLALASIAARRQPGYDQDHQDVVLEPSYGQLDYYAPVLLFLAREYRRGICQHLALWDETLGSLQRTRYVTPHGEALLFELGGYAYVWFDPSVTPEVGDARLSYHFPSVDEAYLRASFEADDLLVGVRKGEVVIHAGGLPIVIEPMAGREAPGLKVQSLTDDGQAARVRCSDASESKWVDVALDRQRRTLTVRRHLPDPWSSWSHSPPEREGETLTWANGARLRVVSGKIGSVSPVGYGPRLATGFLKLELADPAPRQFPQVTIDPSVDGDVAVELSLPTAAR